MADLQLEEGGDARLCRLRTANYSRPTAEQRSAVPARLYHTFNFIPRAERRRR
jgi:hypothetical protein